jgi:O-antigen/teichoic acid export membrane protein
MWWSGYLCGPKVHLFDLTPLEKTRLRQFWRWHLGYLLVVALFFSLIYLTGLFRTNPFLREKFIFLILAPVCTGIFIFLSPWRRMWREALVDMHRRLEGQRIFCVLAGFVFLFGFYIYSIFIWGLGALGPALVHM